MFRPLVLLSMSTLYFLSTLHDIDQAVTFLFIKTNACTSDLIRVKGVSVCVIHFVLNRHLQQQIYMCVLVPLLITLL